MGTKLFEKWPHILLAQSKYLSTIKKNTLLKFTVNVPGSKEMMRNHVNPVYGS
jgi:hypothetical protein